MPAGEDLSKERWWKLDAKAEKDPEQRNQSAGANPQKGEGGKLFRDGWTPSYDPLHIANLAHFVHAGSAWLS